MILVEARAVVDIFDVKSIIVAGLEMLVVGVVVRGITGVGRSVALIGLTMDSVLIVYGKLGLLL